MDQCALKRPNKWPHRGVPPAAGFVDATCYKDVQYGFVGDREAVKATSCTELGPVFILEEEGGDNRVSTMSCPY